MSQTTIIITSTKALLAAADNAILADVCIGRHYFVITFEYGSHPIIHVIADLMTRRLTDCTALL